MKPPEVGTLMFYMPLYISLELSYIQILSMIEEAAGTRMYESKRISAERD